jgi:hypothetical protein
MLYLTLLLDYNYYVKLMLNLLYESTKVAAISKYFFYPKGLCIIISYLVNIIVSKILNYCSRVEIWCISLFLNYPLNLL